MLAGHLQRPPCASRAATPGIGSTAQLTGSKSINQSHDTRAEVTATFGQRSYDSPRKHLLLSDQLTRGRQTNHNRALNRRPPGPSLATAAPCPTSVRALRRPRLRQVLPAALADDGLRQKITSTAPIDDMTPKRSNTSATSSSRRSPPAAPGAVPHTQQSSYGVGLLEECSSLETDRVA